VTAAPQSTARASSAVTAFYASASARSDGGIPAIAVALLPRQPPARAGSWGGYRVAGTTTTTRADPTVSRSRGHNGRIVAKW
jgi:hypothetical protein